MTAAELKMWRESLGLSQRAAAIELGVALPTYQAMERGTSFSTGKPVEIDRRTELACKYLALKPGAEPTGYPIRAPQK